MDGEGSERGCLERLGCWAALDPFVHGVDSQGFDRTLVKNLMQKDLETDKSSRKRRTRASASGLSTILQQMSSGVAVSVWLRNMVSKRERWSGQWT